MILITCDRCGKELPVREIRTNIITPVSDTKWDLCSSCMVDFRQWIKKGVTEEHPPWESQSV